MLVRFLSYLKLLNYLLVSDVWVCVANKLTGGIPHWECVLFCVPLLTVGIYAFDASESDNAGYQARAQEITSFLERHRVCCTFKQDREKILHLQQIGAITKIISTGTLSEVGKFDQ